MSAPEKETSKIVVPSEDPNQDKDKEQSIDAKRAQQAEQQEAFAKKQPDDQPDELSEEDEKLKETLELLVKTIMDTTVTPEIQRQAMDQLKTEIRTSTSSMTSVPKPLKFLKPHWDPLRTFYSTSTGPNQGALSDILSVLAMTMNKESKRLLLEYKLKGDPNAEIGQWGHEYVRSLAGEIGAEYTARLTAENKNEPMTDLYALVDQIIPFDIKNHAEVEAVDLLFEVELVDKLIPHMNKDNYKRVADYLFTSAAYLSDQDERDKTLDIAYTIYLSNKDNANALRVAMKLDSKTKMVNCFKDLTDRASKIQLGLILGSNRVVLTEEDFQGKGRSKSVMQRKDEEGEEDDDDEPASAAGDDIEAVLEAIGNVQLSSNFQELARELDVKEAKLPQDIYKSHLDAKNKRAEEVDSAKQNLAATLVNALVNCAFGNDKLMTPLKSDWLYKTKGDGMLSATASLGMIMLWDVDSGFSAVDKYSFSSQNYVKAGALLAAGILNSGVTSEMDAALALLTDHVTSDDLAMKTAAVFGLGLAYAGSGREDVLETLVPLIIDDKQPMEVVALTCLSLGLVFVGHAHSGIAESIVEAFLDRSETDLKDSSARLMCLGLGLLFLGVGEKMSASMRAVAAVEHPIKEYLLLTIETCAYAGTGNVLAIQRMLGKLTEHIIVDKEEDKEENKDGKDNKDAKDAKDKEPRDPLKGIFQEVAVLGIAMIAMGDDLSEQMALRSLDHALQYGELNVRRAVPFALSMISISNPRITVIDSLGKLSHDSDQRLSQNAVLALGFVGAGTNNSRIANLLRQLAVYYVKEPNHLFLVRLAQGLLHLGKGLMTLSPFHSDKMLMSRVGMAGLLTMMHSCLDLSTSLLSHRHYLIFSLCCTIRPRMLMTINEDGKTVPVSVRVGQAVDTVGQPGNPKRITGFQSHKTSVLLSHGERAELSTDEYIPLTTTLEGVVVVKTNPDSEFAAARSKSGK